VYDNGEVYATRLYGFSPAFEINNSNYDTYAPDRVISFDKIGSKVLLNLKESEMIMTLADGSTTSKSIDLPTDSKYIGAEVEIFNPNGMPINLCNFIPECNVDDFYKKGATQKDTHYYFNGYNWANIKNSCSLSDNKTYKYIKLKCMATQYISMNASGLSAILGLPNIKSGMYYQFYFWVIEKFIE
jgi:hypothetical protein